MKISSRCFRWGGLAALLLLLAGGAQAATYLKQVSTTSEFEMMGQKQPARTDTSVIWIGDQMATMSAGAGMTTILRADKGMLYFVDPGERAYAEMPLGKLGDLKAMMGAEGADEEEAEQMAAMANAMLGSMQVSVTPTGEKKRVRDWDASLYRLEMSIAGMGSKGEIWASKDLKADYSMFYTLTNAMQAQMPGFARVTEEMKKIQGIPVLSVTEMQVMGATMKSTTELLECGERAAPAGIFELPAGFTQKPFGEMRGGHR